MKVRHALHQYDHDLQSKHSDTMSGVCVVGTLALATRLRQGSVSRFFPCRLRRTRPRLELKGNGWHRSLLVKHGNRDNGSRKGGTLPRPIPSDPLTDRAGRYINMGSHNQQSQPYQTRSIVCRCIGAIWLGWTMDNRMSSVGPSRWNQRCVSYV